MSFFNEFWPKVVLFWAKTIVFKVLLAEIEVMNSIVGRKKEIKQLDKVVNSHKSEFVAIYGRRRVGKTFLVREYFQYRFDFQLTGLANATTEQQLTNFHTALVRQSPNYLIFILNCPNKHNQK